MRFDLSDTKQMIEARDLLVSLSMREKIVEIEVKKPGQRTLRQNAALHKLFELLSEALNDAGLDMKKTLQKNPDIPWTPANIKEYIWKPVQLAQLGKESTTQLTTKEIDEVFDTINRHIGNQFGIHIPFPSIEDVILKGRV